MLRRSMSSRSIIRKKVLPTFHLDQSESKYSPVLPPKNSKMNDIMFEKYNQILSFTLNNFNTWIKLLSITLSAIS